MEDSHIIDINDSSGLFGVFDGHGGKEVALYVERHFAKSLYDNSAFI